MAAGDGVYATEAQFTAYVEGWTTTNQAALKRLLDRAARDVDTLVGPWTTEANGYKFGNVTGFGEGTTNPKGLDDIQKLALADATCARAEYRYHQGEDATAQQPERTVSGPDFSISYGEDGRDPVGPKLRQELIRLAHVGLVIGAARARA